MYPNGCFGNVWELLEWNVLQALPDAEPRVTSTGSRKISECNTNRLFNNTNVNIHVLSLC